MLIARKYRLGLALYVIALTGCASNQASGDLQLYLDVKEKFISGLEAGSRFSGSESNYRLVTIPPLIEPYRPGTPLRRGSAEPLTDACLVPLEQLPETSELPEPPGFSYESSFQLGVGLPEILNIVSKEVADLRATIVTKSSAMLRFADLRQLNARTDTLKIAALNDRCMNAIAGIDILMIRGIIYATEAISNRHTFGADTKIILAGQDTLSVRYDSSGGYEVKEAKPKPKFWIVSEWRVDILGLQQSASPVARREAIATYLQENIAGLPLTEKLPTKETVKEYIDKLAPAAPINLRIHSINPD